MSNTGERKRKSAGRSRRYIFTLDSFMKKSHLWAFYQQLSHLTRGTVYLHAVTYHKERVWRGRASQRPKRDLHVKNRSTETHSPACKILKGAHTLTHTHRTMLFNLSPRSFQDYVRWDKIDHIWWILMNNSRVDILTQSLHLVECSLDCLIDSHHQLPEGSAPELLFAAFTDNYWVRSCHFVPRVSSISHHLF